MKKHCHNCKHLDWEEGDYLVTTGWFCNKREYKTENDERKHLCQLDSKQYRLRGKSCFEGGAT